MLTGFFSGRATTIVVFVVILVILAITIFFVRKKKKFEKYKNIKDARKKINKYKLRKNFTELHISLDLSTPSSKIIASHIDEYEIINLGEGVDILLNAQKSILFLSHIQVPDLLKLKSKLGITFSSLTYHYNLDSETTYVEGVLPDIHENIPVKEFSNVVFCFNSKGDKELVTSYNKIIGKNDTIKLDAGKKVEKLQAVEATINKVVIANELDMEAKYFSIQKLRKVALILDSIYAEPEEVFKETFVFLPINTNHEIHIKKLARKNILSFISPSKVLVSFISIALSLIFITNIFSQLNSDLETEYSKFKYNKNRPQQLNSIFLKSKNDIKNRLWMSWLYPDSIKYKKINFIYANTIAKSILLPSFRETKNVTQLTAYLLYLTYLANNDENDESIDILSNLSKLSKENLQYIMKYSSSETRRELISSADKYINEVINNHGITFNERFNEILSLTNFNINYLKISASQRIKNINELYSAYLSTCNISRLLKKVIANEKVSASSAEIFHMYQNFLNKASLGSCDSVLMNTITDGISIVLQHPSNKPVTSFNMAYHRIDTIMKHLEKNQNTIKSLKDKKIIGKINNGLIHYSINKIISNFYAKKKLPLFNPIKTDFFMLFRPGFYDKYVSISPQYSKQYILDNVLVLKSNVEALLKKLKQVYNIKPSLMIAEYKNSVNSYNKEYISSYIKVLKKLYKNKEIEGAILNNNSLELYLNSMSSEDSAFNSLINYYGENISFEEKNDQFADFSQIKEYFKSDSEYINSEKYENYKGVFEKLYNMLKEEGYQGTYKIINDGFKPLKEVYSQLKSIKDNKTYLYPLLKKHLDLVISTIGKIAVKEAIDSLEGTVDKKYEYIKGYMPFNFNSIKALSDNELTDRIGNKGDIYTKLVKYLKPVLKYNKIEGYWYNDGFNTPKELEFLKIFNKVYGMNHLLWNRKGLPIPLKIEVSPVINKRQNYMFSSIVLNSENFINSLNVGYSDPVVLNYKWNSAETVTFVIKLDNGETIERNYTGEWALLKAFKKANCTREICTWKIEYKGKEYTTSFKVRSRFLNMVMNLGKESLYAKSN